MYFKKGISPVVAVALLLVVAVVAVTSFQTWFSSYSSQLYNDAEVKSGDSTNTQIERVIDSTLYFRNGFDNISISNVTVEGIGCNVSNTYSKGVKQISLTNNCTQNLSTTTPEIVVYTNKGIYSEKYFNKKTTTLSQNEETGSGSGSCTYEGLYDIVANSPTTKMSINNYQVVFTQNQTSSISENQAANSSWVLPTNELVYVEITIDNFNGTGSTNSIHGGFGVIETDITEGVFARIYPYAGRVDSQNNSGTTTIASGLPITNGYVAGFSINTTSGETFYQDSLGTSTTGRSGNDVNLANIMPPILSQPGSNSGDSMTITLNVGNEAYDLTPPAGAVDVCGNSLS